jgi:hypothetical protein
MINLAGILPECALRRIYQAKAGSLLAGIKLQLTSQQSPYRGRRPLCAWPR